LFRFLIFPVFLIGLIGASAFAQPDRPGLEAYGKLPLISSAEMSPDGSKIATIVNSDQGTRLVVFNPSGGVIKQIGIAKTKARGVSFYGNQHVVLTVSQTTRTLGFKGEYEFSGSFAISLDDDKIITLLKGTKGLFPAQSGLGDIVGRGSKPDEVLMPAYMRRDGTDPTFDLLRVSLKSGRGKRLRRGKNETIDWFADGNGNALVREDYDNARDTYEIKHLVDGNWKTLFKDEDAPIPPLAISGVMPDNSGLVFVSVTDDEDGFDELLKLGFDGEITGPLLAQPGKEIDRIYTDGERRVIGVRYSGVEPTYDFLDEKIAKAHKDVAAKLPRATLYLDSWSDDRSKLLYHMFEGSIGDVWLVVDADTGAMSVLVNNRGAISADQIATVSAIEYPARDGLSIPGILTSPPQVTLANNPNLPLIVLPHGGPSSYDKLDFDWMAQYFANRGYLVLQPNFRGSSGYGLAFLDAGRGEWGGKMQDDITDGIEALSNSGMVDKSRVCIVGASYGGYAALAGAAFTPDLYKCVIAIAPVSDLNKMLRDVKRDRGRHHWVLDYWEGLMADGDARKTKLESISPVNFVDNVTAPVLLLHGDDDTVVPYNQSTVMERALRRAGKPVELIKLKGEDHWLSVADTRLQTLREMDRFIAEHLPITE